MKNMEILTKLRKISTNVYHCNLITPKQEDFSGGYRKTLIISCSNEQDKKERNSRKLIN